MVLKNNNTTYRESDKVIPTCAKEGCKERLHGLNSKHCKLCNELVCMDHLQYQEHDCIKVRYVKYIRKTWLRKTGQNLSTGLYLIVCETCNYVSDAPALIEFAGFELESHLNNNESCRIGKRTFLEEFVYESRQDSEVRSSYVEDPSRKLWVCAHCRPPAKFTSRDDYISHHSIHN